MARSPSARLPVNSTSATVRAMVPTARSSRGKGRTRTTVPVVDVEVANKAAGGAEGHPSAAGDRAIQASSANAADFFNSLLV